MYGGGTGAWLLVVAAFSAAVADITLWPSQNRPSLVYRPNMNAVELLNHVMKHEAQWTNVLQEAIKKLGDPPYTDRAFTAPRVVPPPADGATPENTVYDVHAIVTRVVRRYITIRSFVEYGAKAVRRALSCFAFRHLLFQSHCLSIMIVQKAEPIDVLTAATKLKESVGHYINMLAAVHDADLTISLDLYWEAVRLTQYDTVQYVQRQSYPKSALNTLDLLREEINRYLSAQCHEFTTDDEFFRRTGVRKKDAKMVDASLLPLVSTDILLTTSLEHALFLAQYAEDLGIVTMPEHQWSQLFFTGGRPKPATNEMDETNPPVTVDPSSPLISEG